MAEANSSSSSKGFARAISKKVFRTKEKVIRMTKILDIIGNFLRTNLVVCDF